MPKGPPKRPATIDAIGGISVPDPATDRALRELGDQVGRVAGAARRFDVVRFDLVAGLNKVPHSLGRAAVGALVVPSVAAADFGYAAADQGANQQRDRFVFITCTGTAQPKALVLVT